MTRCYATLSQIRTRFGILPTDPTTSDADLLLQLQNASAMIDRHMNMFVFEPMLETRLFDWRDPSYLVLKPSTLLAAPTAATDSEGNAITAGNLTGITYKMYPKGPYQALRVKNGASFGTGSARSQAISMTGLFGLHLDYSGAWVVTDAVGVGGIDNSVTTVPVADSTRFSAGMLISIGTEFMRVTATPTATTITVRRAENGSSPASAIQTAPISVYSPMADIVELTLTVAAWLRTREFTSTDTRGAGNTESEAPSNLPDLLCDMACDYKENFLWQS